MHDVESFPSFWFFDQPVGAKQLREEQDLLKRRSKLVRHVADEPTSCRYEVVAPTELCNCNAHQRARKSQESQSQRQAGTGQATLYKLFCDRWVKGDSDLQTGVDVCGLHRRRSVESCCLASIRRGASPGLTEGQLTHAIPRCQGE
jgi:hypothetical protein